MTAIPEWTSQHSATFPDWHAHQYPAGRLQHTHPSGRWEHAHDLEASCDRCGVAGVRLYESGPDDETLCGTCAERLYGPVDAP